MQVRGASNFELYRSLQILKVLQPKLHIKRTALLSEHKSSLISRDLKPSVGLVLSSSPHNSLGDTRSCQFFIGFAGLVDGSVCKTEPILSSLALAKWLDFKHCLWVPYLSVMGANIYSNTVIYLTSMSMSPYQTDPVHFISLFCTNALFWLSPHFQYPSGLLHWHRGSITGQSCMIAPAPITLSARIRVNVWCVFSSSPSAAYMRQLIGSALVQIMACCLFGTKPLSKPMLGYCQ